ncbi:MAG: toll/interleukin-1 receptor domain-containing protein, partial [Chloroflexota bacterium]
MNELKVFISYSRRDEKIARQLAGIFFEIKIPFFLDVLHIHPGEHWDRALHEALCEATHLILIHTSNSFNSNNVWDEWSFFLQENKPVIPLMFDDSKLPFRLVRFQYIDFTQRTIDAALIKLISRLKDIDLAGQIHRTKQTLHTVDAEATQLSTYLNVLDDDDTNNHFAHHG